MTEEAEKPNLRGTQDFILRDVCWGLFRADDDLDEVEEYRLANSLLLPVSTVREVRKELRA